MTEKNTKRSLSVLIFPALAILVTIWIFAKPLFSEETISSMDNPPIYTHSYQERTVESMTGAWRPVGLGESVAALPLHHSRLLAAVLPPFVYRLASYIVNVLLLIGAGYYLLRGRGFRGISAWLPAIALGYSGYMFTLISAGHIGMFDMYPYAVFAFGLIDRGISRRSLWHFAAAGLCIGFGVGAQPDVQFLFGCLLAAFAIFLVVSNWAANKENLGKFLVTLGLGVVVSGAFFAGSALTLFSNLNDVYIPQRNAMRGDTTESKWIYSTNWSMPPEDVLEFVSPNVRGRETTDRESPYWGRLGQADGWSPTNKQGFMNFRQHNVYLGAIQILFGIYAIVCLFRKKDRDTLGKSKRTGTWFWSGAFLATVILACGRYTPIYKLFWLLPGAGRVRCPVKFIHLTELAVAVLFATGLAFFLRDLAAQAKDPERKGFNSPLLRFSIASAALGLIFIVAAPLTSGGGGLALHWQMIGYSQIADLLEKNMSGALMHTAVLLFIVSSLFFIASKFSEATWCKPTVCAILTATVLIDLGITTRPFVRTQDVQAIYQQNPIAEMIVNDPAPGRAAYMLSARQKMDPLYTSFVINEVDIVDLRQYVPPADDELAFYQALGRNPYRLWELTNTRYIIGHLQQLNQLLANPAFNVKAYFNADTSGRIQLSDQANGKQILVENTNVLPRAQLLHAWETLAPEEVIKRIPDPKWDPSKLALLSGELPPRESTLPASPVTVKKYSRKRIEMETNGKEDGVLVLNDRYNPDWQITVNGEPAEVIQANYIMRGVKVPAGPATIKMNFAPYKSQFMISSLVSIIVIAWGIFIHLPARRKTHTPSTDNKAEAK